MNIVKFLEKRVFRLFFLMIAFIVGMSISSADAFAQTGLVKATPTVIGEIMSGNPQDLIVLFDDSAIENEASMMRDRIGLPFYNQEIVNFKAGMYKPLKDGVLSLLPAGQFETLMDYSHLPMMFLRIKSLPALERLLEQRRVLVVYEDGRYRHFLSQSLPLINQPAVAASGKIGSGTAVAVLDTGINYTRSAFGTCTSPAPGFCSDTNPPQAPEGCKVACVRDFTPTNDNSLDDNGHGTNVSGIVLGVAPDTRIVGLDVFRTDGFAYDSDLIAAVNWTIANRSAYNITAINMSLGGGGYNTICTGALATPLANARTAGILAAIASGNDGFNNKISYPACLPSVVSVGAVYDSNIGSRSWSVCIDSTTFADKIACFSNSANFLTMLAPGCLITAANLSMCGTSMAAPHIAGSIGVLKGADAFPLDSPDMTISRMTSTGVPVTDPKNAITKPRINLLAATSGGGGSTHSISGRVTSGVGFSRGLANPLSGVTLTLSGAATMTTTTDANGDYSFTGLSNGNYTITPSRTGYTFTPANRAVSVSGSNITNQNFTGAVSSATFSISGIITNSGNPMANVTVNLTGTANATTTTNISGIYTFTGLSNGSYTVTPSQAGFSFTPAHRSVTINNANSTGQDFVGVAVSPGTYSISGTVRTRDLGGRGGTPLPGVTITLGGIASATTTTDTNGNYSFSGLSNGNYTVTPSQTGHTFTPVSRAVTINNANVTGQNFTRN